MFTSYEVLLKITSYRGSYVIGATDTSLNGVVEYHWPHWLRQSAYLCFKS